MESLVDYHFASGVGTIGLNDGKANVMSPRMLAEINRALDQAESDAAAVVLAGRPGLFSAGFDLAILRKGDAETIEMLRDGFDLATRLLSFSGPVVIACTGHALAMGAFVLLSGDYRVGAAGDWKIGANEVAIGLPMPRPALTIMQQRLTPAAFVRAAALAETFNPANAIEAGWLDQVAPANDVVSTAQAVATRLASLDRKAHQITKRLMRAATVEAIGAGVEREYPLPPASLEP